MFLRSLTLKGFKSFADATTLRMERGVTVVVGPNGSGKSNVVDAIAWVLGAQAPSAVRSQKMDDVIFAGTAKRAALGRAEVALTIDNSDGVLPIEFTEVTVARTLWRTGESEYAINGVPCRLLDVQELLSDSGVGRQQHVIVSQGQIDAVLNARPEDRRSIIEEAAGVLKFRKRKEKAERRLETTEANLLRAQDLVREVRRQLRPLERQAEAARRHADLVAELTALRTHLAGREVATLRARLERQAGERTRLGGEERALRDEMARLDGEVAGAEARLAETGGFDVSDDLMRAEHLRERARGSAALLAERRRGLVRELERLAERSGDDAVEREATRVQAELDEVGAAAAGLGPAAAELEEAEQVLAGERAEFDAGGEDVGSSGRAAGAAAEVRGELRTLRATVERTRSEVNRSAERLAQLDAKATRLTDETHRLRTECAESETAEAPLVAEQEQAEARRAAAEVAQEAAEHAQRSAAGERATWSARADALALALDGARARAGAERLAGLEGVLGTLLDLVEVDPGWEAAFEAAAGEALAAVVVHSAGAARAALSHLSAADTAGAVLALGAVAATEQPPAVGEQVRRHVRSAAAASAGELDTLLDVLVGGAVAIDGGWEAAVDAVLAHPRAVVVTREGDRFGAQGWRLGVASAGATGAALEEARAKVAAAEADVTRTEHELRLARAELAAARQAEHDVARRLDQTDSRFTAASEALARAQAERREVATQAEALRAGATELQERLERDSRRLAELEEILPSLAAEESAEVEALRRRQAARAQLDERAAVLAGLRRDLAVKAAGLDERRAAGERRLQELERRRVAEAQARAQAQARRAAADHGLVVVERLSAVVEAHRQAVDSAHAELAEQRRRQSDAARAVAQELDQLRRARTAAERQLEERRERLRTVELDEAEARLRLEATVEALQRDLEITPEEAEATECPPLPDGTTATARARDLDRELRALGPINPLALEEFEALKERATFLEEQLEDVRTSRRELLRVIKAVDTEIQQVFGGAFADVSENFTHLFATLFPGGSGKLVLTDPADLLNTGIEVEAKPSGKNVKKLSLLSGGERSLTALAFLFAVFRSRPSPFYVMDEVEAALDDLNLHRFLGLLEEFRREAQLIVVSHQKRTMEAADCLFGVSMQPGGSSKVVSERVTAVGADV